MTHPSVEEVALHLEGMLAPADEERVRTHLEQCADCTATARDLRGVTEQLHAAARSGGSSPSIPTDVAARVESALAREADERGAAAVTVSEEVPAEPRASVGDLAERRRRRRRVLSGGLLAAAAATVVAAGLGQLIQGEGSFESAGGSAGSVAAERAPAQQRHAFRGGPQTSTLGEDNQGRLDATQPQRTREAGLIEGVAAAHSPALPQHDLLGCVQAALGDDLGPVASYAVRLPGAAGARGVVVLRPTQAPTQGVLIACTPQPHVLARRGLHP